MQKYSLKPFLFGLLIIAGVLLLGLGFAVLRGSLRPQSGGPTATAQLVPGTPATPTPTPAASETVIPPLLPSQETSATPTAAQDAPALNLEPLASQPGWQVLFPTNLPENYNQQSAYFDASHQMVILTYLVTRPLPGSNDASLTASNTITVLQAQTNNFMPMQPGPDARLENFQIDGQSVVYTTGAWDTEFVKDESDPNGGKMVSVWRSDLPVQALYWQAEGLYFSITTDDPSITQPQLLDLAASLKN